MNAPPYRSVEWPERIYYVCNSGSGIVVNATPLVQAGAHRVAGVKILCGVRDPEKPTPAEQREAIRPAKRLTAFARRLGIKTVDEPSYGRPDAYAAWSNVLDEAARRARTLDSTLVYNVTGGPRTLPLAAIVGASNEDRASMVALAVSFSDRTCTQLVFNSEGVLTGEHSLPAHGRVGFDDLIALYGYREQDPAARQCHEAFIGEQRSIAEQVLKVMRKRGGKSAIAALHWSMQFDSTGESRERGASATPFCVTVGQLRAHPKALGGMIRAFDGLPGLTIVRTSRGNVESIKVVTEAARRFIGGVWLEAVIFGLVRDCFRKTRAEVVAGAVLAVEGTPSRSSNILPDDTELDVAIVLDDQLHVIEVKAVTRTGKSGSGPKFGDYVPKLVKIRQELGSQVMRAFLVAPLLSGSELERGRFIERADKQGVRLLYGHRALGLLGQELRRLQKDRRLAAGA